MARGEAELGEVAVDGGGVASSYGGQYGGEAEILGEGQCGDDGLFVHCSRVESKY